MAQEPVITNTSAPGQIEMAYGPNVWTLSDTEQTNPRYVLQIWTWYNLSSPLPELKYDLRQNSNPAGVAHFDVQRILQRMVQPQQDLSNAALTWFDNQNNNTSEVPNEDYQDFAYTVKWGYENAAGVAVIQGESEPKMVFAGRKPHYELQWNVSEFRPKFDPVNPTFGIIDLAERARPLTEAWDAYPEITDAERAWPVKAMPVTPNQNLWLPMLIQGEDRYDPDNLVVKRTPYAIVTAYTAAMGQIFSLTVNPVFLDECDVANENDNLLNHVMIPVLDVGIDQIVDFYPEAKYIYIDTGVDYQHTVLGSCIPAGGNKNAYGAWKLTIEAECNDYEEVVLTWHNYWGFQDFFTFQKENTKQIQVDRQEYYQQPGSWQASTLTLTQEQSGRRVFAQTAEEEWTLRTRWLTQGEADWLRRLVESGWCAIYQGHSRAGYIPCTVVTSRWTQRNERRQKLFQFEIQIRLSNNYQLLKGWYN